MEWRFKERELELIKDASTQGYAAPRPAIKTLVLKFPDTGVGANGVLGG
jgi:hypothetical protein